MTEKEDLKQQIDNDEGLKSKKRLLVVASLIMLAIQFSGAKVVEANTFILKLSFDHQAGIPLLLVLSICYLMIRYYNYARPYHEKLYYTWTKRMLSHTYFYSYFAPADIRDGLVVKLSPEGFDMDRFSWEGRGGWDYEYVCKFPLVRGIKYTWYNDYEESEIYVGIYSNVSFFKYLNILLIEYANRVLRFFNYRENLDIISPYIIGVVSIASYYYNETIEKIIKSVT